MNRTKKTSTIVAALVGMLILMLTATSVMAAPRHRRRGHRRHRIYRRHNPRWSNIIGGILNQRPRKHYVPGHYVAEHRQVLVMPGHFETQTRQMLVEPGHFEPKTVPAVTKTVAKADGTTEVVIVQPAQTTKVWIPDRYETRMTKVWIPARYETHVFKRWVPGHWTY